MYNSKRFNNMKTVSIENGTAIAFVTKSGTVMGEHCIRQIDDESGMKLAIAYNLTPAAARSLSSKTHSAKEDTGGRITSWTWASSAPTSTALTPATPPAATRRTPKRRCSLLLGTPMGLRLLLPRTGE